MCPVSAEGDRSIEALILPVFQGSYVRELLIAPSMGDENGDGVLPFGEIGGHILLAADILSIDVDSHLIRTLQMECTAASVRNVHDRAIPGKSAIITVGSHLLGIRGSQPLRIVKTGSL